MDRTASNGNGATLWPMPSLSWLRRTNRPGKTFVAAKEDDIFVIDRDRGRDTAWFAFKRDRAGVWLKPIEPCAVEGCEGLKAIERIFFVENLHISLQRCGAAKDAGRAALRFLPVSQMRCGVGADEVAPGSGRRGFAQRLAMMLALRHRQ